jgi:HK97 family phage prohead protease
LAEKPDVVLLVQHGRAGTGMPLARTSGGTLSLTEDERGLFLEARLDPEDPDSELLVRKLARGDLNGEASFGFCAANQKWSEDYTRRTILTATLHKGDVSVVDFGANEHTSVSLDADVAPRAMVRQPVTLAPLPDHTTAARARLAALRWSKPKG